jgi:hypothetical protein
MRDPDEFRAFVQRWYELWNANDKQGWLDHWRAAAPGEPCIEDPVGTPLKQGWDMVEELWDRTGEDHFKVTISEIYICGDEAAAVCRSEGTFGGETFQIGSVDVHQFHGDRLAVRSYWEIPPGIPYGQWTATAGVPLAQ